VRELALLAKRLVGIHGREGPFKKAFLPERMLARAPSGPTPPDDPAAEGRARAAGAPGVAARARRKTDDDDEFDALIVALRDNEGSVARAAEAIGIGRARAYRLIAARPGFSLEDARRKP
jgi:transcriptional regulator of acetoin/glycerol metabolism